MMFQRKVWMYFASCPLSLNLNCPEENSDAIHEKLSVWDIKWFRVFLLCVTIIQLEMQGLGFLRNKPSNEWD